MRQFRDKPNDGIDERTLLIRRVSKKTTGGNYATYSALVAVGDRNGKVGVGLGRGREVPQALGKATTYARKHMITVPRINNTITHQSIVSYKAAKILLKPAPEGTGLKIGGVARVLFDLAGIYNASGKLLGSRNQITNTYAVMKAFSLLKQRENTPKQKKEVTSEEKAPVPVPKKSAPKSKKA
ncbi:30S ribosomal protein S5 [Candidatus Woesebacteria bacterium]|nr:30S ribosomal protein S5 [Candidatus Woesebacteria bacterium]